MKKFRLLAVVASVIIFWGISISAWSDPYLDQSNLVDSQHAVWVHSFNAWGASWYDRSHILLSNAAWNTDRYGDNPFGYVLALSQLNDHKRSHALFTPKGLGAAFQSLVQGLVANYGYGGSYNAGPWVSHTGKVVFETGSGLVKYDPHTRKAQWLCNNPSFCFTPLGWNAQHTKFLFLSEPDSSTTPPLATADSHWKIVSIDIASKKTVTVYESKRTADLEDVKAAALSPDGRELAYERPIGHGRFEVFLVHLDSTATPKELQVPRWSCRTSGSCDYVVQVVPVIIWDPVRDRFFVNCYPGIVDSYSAAGMLKRIYSAVLPNTQLVSFNSATDEILLVHYLPGGNSANEANDNEIGNAVEVANFDKAAKRVSQQRTSDGSNVTP